MRVHIIAFYEVACFHMGAVIVCQSTTKWLSIDNRYKLNRHAQAASSRDRSRRPAMAVYRAQRSSKKGGLRFSDAPALRMCASSGLLPRALSP